jgi:hypothetical protein
MEDDVLMPMGSGWNSSLAVVAALQSPSRRVSSIRMIYITRIVLLALQAEEH